MAAPDRFNHQAQPAPHVVTTTSTRSIGNRRPIDFIVYDLEEGAARTIRPRGRDAWALAKLLLAGSSGIVPIEHVGPRWSHYVFKLRTVYGLYIETITEAHGGDFAGRHARYVVQSNIAFADPTDAKAYADGDR